MAVRGEGPIPYHSFCRFSEIGEVIQEAIESYEFLERDGAEVRLLV